MAVNLSILILIVWIHFVADFIMQTDKMALGKSSSVKWLSFHVGVYSLPWLIFGWKYAVVNGCLHWLTDFWSSKATSSLWKREKRHWFFVVIGADQAVHLTCLLSTIPLMGWS